MTTFRRLAILLVAAVVLGGLLAAAFVIGLNAGAERDRIYSRAKQVKERFDAAMGRLPAEEPTDSSSDGRRITLPDNAEIAREQSRQAPPANFADWAGFYRIATSQKDLAGFQPVNPWLPPIIWARLQPWARAKLEATDGVADDTGQICQPNGWLRATAFSGGFLFLPAREKVVIVYTPIETSGIQRVYLNRTHPRNLLPTWNGDSVGYWEGDTLFVDTVGFNDKSWLQPSMEPHTEEAHVVQRIRQVRGGAYLEVQYTVEDRKALASAYTYSRYFKRVGDEMPEDVCNDDVQIFRDARNQSLKTVVDRARRIR